MNENENDDRYLWDGTGEPDAEVARLEALLKPLAHRGTMPALPPRDAVGLHVSPFGQSRASKFILRGLALAASLLLVVALAWVVLSRRTGWNVTATAGVPNVDGARVASDATLRVGEWLVTDASSRARMSAGQIGRVDVEPNTRLQLVEAKGREHRLALERGTIHAQIWAPPKFFYVNTPSAEAIDLGCAYSLHVDEDGAGTIRVTHGWVEFNSNGRESFIPEGAICMTRPETGPGTPRYDDAPSGYAEALAVLDFGNPAAPERGAALELVLSRARPRDGLTLWHLLSRGTPAEREQVYDRLAALIPPPEGCTREKILAGDRQALDTWWDKLGVNVSTWWRLLKKKW